MLKRIPTINVQKLFGIAVGLKVILAFLGYLLVSPVWIGLIAPLTVMIAYMVIGYRKRAHEVSEEKFADSCYYIGFVFTIVSIIVCLFDVPKMASGAGLYEIAVRFGAAMLSTVLGMIVRVYLVSFQKDTSDAIRDVEATLIEATRAFTLQIQDTVQHLKSFEAQVVDASKASVAGVQLQVEALGRNFSESLADFYKQVSDENRKAFEIMLDEVRGSTVRLSEAVNSYSGGMQQHLGSIEGKVTQFADAVTDRLKTTTFPDDFFAKQLQAPLEQFKVQADLLGQNVKEVSDQVKTSSTDLATILKTITSKTKKTQEAMDAVVDLSNQHHTLLTNADAQISVLGGLTASLDQIHAGLSGALAAIDRSQSTASDLATRLSSLVDGTDALRTDLKASFEVLYEKLDANSTVANSAIQKYEFQATTLQSGAEHVIAALTRTAGLADRIVGELTTSAEQLKTISAASERSSAHSQLAAEKTTEILQSAKEAAIKASEAAESILGIGTKIKDHVSTLAASANASEQLGPLRTGTVSGTAEMQLSSNHHLSHLGANPSSAVAHLPMSLPSADTPLFEKAADNAAAAKMDARG